MPSDHPYPLPHAFRVNCRCEAEVVVVECFGRLTSDHALQLKEAVREHIAPGRRVILDLREVPGMDSSGIGTIVGLYVSGRSRNCRVEMVNATQAVRDLLSLTNLLSLFESAGRFGKSI